MIFMPRYKLLIEYDGTSFNGWQRQPEGRTIEGEIEAALARVLRQPVDVIGQGRTDSGVHAEGQTAHFDFSEPLEFDRLLFALLGVLPREISVWHIEEVDDDFHARFDAKLRQYRYQITTRRAPLVEHMSEMILEDLNTELMRTCADMIKGTHNFDSFTRPDNENPNSECEVSLSELYVDQHLITYRIAANRFVRHMVRRLTGTMIQVGQGKRTLEEFTDLLNNPHKDKSGYGASAKGLILEKVKY